LQAFAEYAVPLGNDAQITLRGGRQMVSLGSERLVGTRYGTHVPLAFDGARGIISVGKAKISLLALRPVAPGPGSFDDHRSRTKSLWGAYAVLPDLDLYYLGYRNTAAHFGTRHGTETHHSIGARYHGNRDAWHRNIEGIAQFGQFAGGSIGTWTLATEIGRRLPDLPLHPDATVRLNIISGDTNPADRRLGTFNTMFLIGKYFGELSPFGPYNIVSLNPSLGMALGHGVSASIAGMTYWRYTSADGIYDIPGNLTRAPVTAQSRFIGKQVEASLAWQVTPELELSTSLSAFAPGGFIRETGAAHTITLLSFESNFPF
jgi:hypothetical protein